MTEDQNSTGDEGVNENDRAAILAEYRSTAKPHYGAAKVAWDRAYEALRAVVNRDDGEDDALKIMVLEVIDAYRGGLDREIAYDTLTDMVNEHIDGRIFEDDYGLDSNADAILGSDELIEHERMGNELMAEVLEGASFDEAAGWIRNDMDDLLTKLTRKRRVPQSHEPAYTIPEGERTGDRSNAAREMLLADHQQGDAAIAKAVNLSRQTVREIRIDLELARRIPKWRPRGGR